MPSALGSVLLDCGGLFTLVDRTGRTSWLYRAIVSAMPAPDLFLNEIPSKVPKLS